MSRFLISRIPWSELDFEVMRSRGAGGQSVNRTESAVVVRWNLKDSDCLSDFEKSLLLKRLASKLTLDGELLIRSEVHKSQDLNRKECLEKLQTLLDRGLARDKPRVATKPTRGSQIRRVESKRQRSAIKSGRARVKSSED